MEKKDTSLSKIEYHRYFNEWYEIVKEILNSDEFQNRQYFPHHHYYSVWDHSIIVSFRSFLIAKRLRINPRNCAIAGLLHDFYEVAFIYSAELEALSEKYVKDTNQHKKLFKKHGFTHAKQAAENYTKFFPDLVNAQITNAIKRHMFPLNIIPPRFKEGWIITYVDKRNSLGEIMYIKAYLKYKRNKLNQ